MRACVVGIDPSSRKLAAVVTWSDSAGFAVELRDLPPKMPVETCLLAYVWVRRLIKEQRDKGYRVHVFIEAPISAVAKGGVRALIPQAQVSGALMAGAASLVGTRTELVPLTAWKKEVVGKGNATKPQIKEWAGVYWRRLYDKWHHDQDVLDAAGINRFGHQRTQKEKS